MARFRAYTSESSGSDEEGHKPVDEKTPEKQKSPSRVPSKAEREQLSESEESESSASSSSSEMQADELTPSPPRRRQKRKTPDRNALVEDENGEIHFAHEVQVRVSPPSSPSRGSPPRPSLNNRDPTVIPWAQHVGVDAQKMHVMQTSLFRMPEEAAALRALNEPPKAKGGAIRLDIKPKTQAINRKHSRDSDGDGLRLDSREVRVSAKCIILWSNSFL
jgi:nuclear pore complex protein Nup98-Nup96